MPSFTVISDAVEGETYHSEKAKGDLVVWRFDVEGVGQVELHKKPGNKPPPKGTIVNGDVKDQRGNKRLFLDKPSQNGSSGSSDDFNRRPDHPLNTARALHTSALSSAPAFIDQMVRLGVVPQPGPEEDDYWELVAQVVGHLKGTYPAAVKNWAKGEAE